MTEISRRDAIALMAALPLASTFGDALSLARAAHAARHALADQAMTGRQYAPQFFSPPEWRVVRVLADLVIPRDARSGSATDAGVPEFIDFTLVDRPNLQAGMRAGLAWLDAESRRRYDRSFAAAAATEQTALLDDIAWPARAPADLDDGVRFFTLFRDMTASGFWSSRIGVDDLQYLGNRAVAQWDGCPDEALRSLGVSYE